MPIDSQAITRGQRIYCLNFSIWTKLSYLRRDIKQGDNQLGYVLAYTGLYFVATHTKKS